ncbi:MAG: aminotransferase class V-fold PLP-dependent enzyme, partial [Acidimicrobiales bacterium]
VGILVVGGGADLRPVLHGGPQENGRRPGTVDPAGIVGTAAALVVATSGRRAEVSRVAALRDRLARGLVDGVGGLVETVPSGGQGAPGKVAGSCHVLVAGVDQEELLLLLDEAGVCASAGAACASGALEPSHVLLAMGLDPARARTAVRFSLGWTTTEADVDAAVAAVAKAVEQLRR